MKNENASLMRLTLWMLIVAAMGIGLVAYPSSGAEATLATQQKSHWKVPAKAKEMKNPLADNSQSVERGRKLYEAWCVMCHGEGGKGDGEVANSLNPRPTDLTEVVKEQSDGELFWKITRGKLPMPGFEVNMGEKERWAIVAFIKSGFERQQKQKGDRDQRR